MSKVEIKRGRIESATIHCNISNGTLRVRPADEGVPTAMVFEGTMAPNGFDMFDVNHAIEFFEACLEMAKQKAGK